MKQRILCAYLLRIASFLRIGMILILLCSFCIPITVHATETEDGNVDISKLTFTKADDPQFFVAYVYVEESETNPYNDKNRDIILYTGGEVDGYLRASYHNFASDYTFEKYGVIRLTGYLPKNSEFPYQFYVKTSDATLQSTSSIGRFGTTSIDMMTDVVLQKNYNEFFFVCGDAHWITTNGESKLDEVYELFHSDSQDINQNVAYDKAIEDELFSYWEEQMQVDPSLASFTTDEGETYSREDMNAAGYDVFVSTEEAQQATQAPVEVTVTEEETESEVIPIAPTAPQSQSSSVGFLPIVLVAAGIIVLAVFLQKQRNRNKSDLYID